MGKPNAGSNPALSAPPNDCGEVPAVICVFSGFWYDFIGRARWGASGAFAAWPRPKSAYAGSNSPWKGLRVWSLPRSSGVEDWVLRGRSLRTPPGPEGSNGKEILLGAAGAPDWSWLIEVSQARKFDEGCTTVHLWNSKTLPGILLIAEPVSRPCPSGVCCAGHGRLHKV